MLADPVRLIQVFSNLPGNASHYSEAEVLVAVTAWGQEADRVASQPSGFDARLRSP